MADDKKTITSGFYDAVNGDRVYTAEDMTKPYSLILEDGLVERSHAWEVGGNSGMTVRVQRGQAMLAGKWIESKTVVLFQVPGNASIYSRIDSIILQVDTRSGVRSAGLVYRTGTAAASPVHPNINYLTGVTEMRIADITVAAAAHDIASADITDYRGTADCPWLQLKAKMTVSVDVQRLTSTHSTTGDETVIPINIAGYNSSADMLEVYINGLLADGKYTAGADSITLNNALPEGNTVTFVAWHVTQE